MTRIMMIAMIMIYDRNDDDSVGQCIGSIPMIET